MDCAGYVLVAPLWIGMLLGQQLAPPAVLDEAAAAFEQGRADEAEQKVNSFLKSHPTDLRALLLKAAVLDSRERWAEAESYYQRALKLAPHSPQALNNAANHYLASGDRGRAREFFIKTVAINPQHTNANLQLAQMSVEDQKGREALAYLSRMGDEANSDATVLLLRARALSLSGQCPAASAILKKLEGQPNADARWLFSAGMAQAGCKQYEAAGRAFSLALDADPRNFDILYNLGLASLRAGHADRAESVLQTALKVRPEDADCLYTLAQVVIKLGRPVEAAALLARAQKAVPDRADILLLLAQVSAQLEFYEDAAATYDRYLKLRPDDDVARRERGFNLAFANQSKRALQDLDQYVRKHPGDAVGYYELAVAQLFEDRSKALASLDHALKLDPALFQARYTRALVNIEEERPEPAIEDLRFFVQREPKDYRALAHLGQAYLALNRASEALDVLERAMAIAPGKPVVLVQYRRALEKLGRKREAAEIVTRLREAGNAAAESRRRVGLIDYLGLAPGEQHARYLENLQRNSAADPSDVRWKIMLARDLLAQGKTADGVEMFRQLKSAASAPAVLADCGRTLLEFEQYEPAREFLEAAVAAVPSLSAARIDLAIVLFRLQSASAALQELDETPAADRRGDYYLLRAQILDAQGKMQEAAEALNQGIQAAPTRPSLYLQASGFLLKHQQYEKALALLEQASRLLPDDRDLLLAQAVTLAVMPRDDDAQKLLAKIQSRWPEWDRPYLVHGMILEIQLKSAEALPLLETAIALGANSPEGYYYQALAITHARPDDLQSAHNAIAKAVALTSKDPYIFLLAGKISLARKDYPAAVEQLSVATHLLPTLIPAHYALHDAYKAIGDEPKSAAELEAIQHIADENAASDKSPFPVEDFVFTVRPPS
jgi:tetratricopeptide (TPR) repeat protein